MSEFVNQWVRCNSCFRNFDSDGGMLTSCGHFFCNRPECRLNCKVNEKITCPICKSTCSCISLSQTLPDDVLQYFEDPEFLLSKTLDVIRFQNQQKDLSRAHFEQQEQKIRELQEVIDDIRSENQKLKNEITKIKIPESRIENEPVMIKENIAKQITTSKRRAKNQDQFTIQTESQVVAPSVQANNTKTITTTQRSFQPSKLFTPTLASRLQGLTGKKLYDNLGTDNNQ
ncbi:hypothetical protein TVAG_163240 [Trichomonas vaginalis G3]|uniref:RING-type domain-containing protein n=1 Tax=Trichomonas vaginalis (strain ATCC PRA-98 / G3) TaxID=412133 RepID=A2DG01_TRIV3|nr:ring finger protein 212B family [Trichomonas vaginalis G3]EAY20628.1 hypothetical protein TVAG_163240 [Trichomonas vaginalis G3]KAI5487343.1 ring finger protein 212B family [Trichomonas vaginalis G3]|eukprot:XP_001581614.1 hypothetical protein [Trichomonas vaginalis G3]